MFAGALGLPAEWAAPTIFGVVVVVIILCYWLLRDRSAFGELEHRIESQDVTIQHLEERIFRVEFERNEQRSLKHAVINELTRAELIVSIVNDLRGNCTDGALDVLEPILSSFMERLQKREAALVAVVLP